MLAFIIYRLLQAVLVMLVVALIAFALFNYIGDPIANMVGQDTTLADQSAKLAPESLYWSVLCKPLPSFDYQPAIHKVLLDENGYPYDHFIDWRNLTSI